MAELTADLPDVVLVGAIDPRDPIEAHIVSCPNDKESSAAWLTEARVMGLLVEALCGHQWIPTRDPERRPICEPCLEEAKRRVEAGE